MSALAGQVVFITGAARGIGAGTARALAARGARLILIDLDAAPLQELVAELGEDRARGAACDVCDLEAMESAAAAGIERFGGIDHVLANAGVASYGSVGAVDPAMFKRVLDVNQLGVFHTVRATLPSVMSWIDTPLVQDAKADLASFRELLSKLPGPLGKTLPLQRCVEAFVEGLEQRKRRVYVPRWVALLAWLKPLATSRFGEREPLKQVPRTLPMMDAEVAELGRATSARNVAMREVSVTPE